MTIRFSCECGKQLAVKDENAGKRVRCPDCGEIQTVPESGPVEAGLRTGKPKQRPVRAAEEDEEDRDEREEDEDRPRKRKKKSSRSGGTFPWLWVGAGVGVLALVAVGVWFLFLRSKGEKP